MILKKLFGIFGEKNVSQKHDTNVVKFERKKSDPMESNTDNSLLAEGYDDAVHNTHHLAADVDRPNVMNMFEPAELDVLNPDDIDIDAMGALPNRDQMFDEGTRSLPGPRAVIETSWTGAPEEGDVVEFEDEDSDEEDVVNELEKLTESDHKAENDADFMRRHPIAAKGDDR